MYGGGGGGQQGRRVHQGWANAGPLPNLRFTIVVEFQNTGLAHLRPPASSLCCPMAMALVALWQSSHAHWLHLFVHSDMSMRRLSQCVCFTLLKTKMKNRKQALQSVKPTMTRAHWCEGEGGDGTFGWVRITHCWSESHNFFVLMC